MNKTKISLLVITAALLGGCANMEVGSKDAKTVATGSAGGANTQNANSKLERCTETLGTVEVVEETDAPWYITLHQHQLGSTVPVLRRLIQQTNCFAVVERGKAMKNMAQERALEHSGELRKKSHFGKGQMISADYSLSPSITFSNQNAGGAGAAIGGLFGSVGAAIGGSMSSKEASTELTLIDNRSGLQLAAAEGSAKNMDFGFVGGLLGGAGGAAGGGYSNTAEGKVIVAAFTDALNNIIIAVRNYKAQNVKGGMGTGGHLKVQQ